VWDPHQRGYNSKTTTRILVGTTWLVWIVAYANILGTFPSEVHDFLFSEGNFHPSFFSMQ
jgi:hypothetical protein